MRQSKNYYPPSLDVVTVVGAAGKTNACVTHRNKLSEWMNKISNEKQRQAKIRRIHN